MRYIDADALKEGLGMDCSYRVLITPNDAVRCMARYIDEAPTADVVEVVRCKDCKYCEIYYPVKHLGIESVKNFYCNFSREVVGRFENDFCSYGERKE